MAILLVYKRMNGEPLGVIDEQGESYFGTGDDHDKALAMASIKVKGTAVPWSVFTERLATGFNHTEIWGTMNTDQDLASAYNTALNNYEASQATQTATDNS